MFLCFRKYKERPKRSSYAKDTTVLRIQNQYNTDFLKTTKTVSIRLGTCTLQMEILKAYLDSDYSLIFNFIFEIFLVNVFIKSEKSDFFKFINHETLNY